MKYVKAAVLRGGIVLVIMMGITLGMRHQQLDAFQVRSTFISGLIMAVVAASSVLYEVDGWSLRKQSLAHFVAMLCTVYPLLLCSGWFAVHGLLDAVKVLGVFLLAGAVLWSLLYAVFSRKQKKQR